MPNPDHTLSRHYRKLRVMNGSRYLTFPREWDLDAYEEYLVQREPTGRITLEPMRTHNYLCSELHSADAPTRGYK